MLGSLASPESCQPGESGYSLADLVEVARTTDVQCAMTNIAFADHGPHWRERRPDRCGRATRTHGGLTGQPSNHDRSVRWSIPM
jgi:hypothetical protein